MSKSKINRHEWLKCVAQSPDLPDRAKSIAVALWSFYNDETGRLDPKPGALADFVKRDAATVKRAISDLIKEGFLDRSEGRGAGNRTVYTLMVRGNQISNSVRKKPAKMTPQTTQKSGAVLHLSDRVKGAVLSKKGRRTAPLHIKAEQPSEQKGGKPRRSEPLPLVLFGRHRFAGNVIDGARLVANTDHHSLNAWADWLAGHYFPKLHALPICSEDESGNLFWYLPTKKPPATLEAEAEAKWYFETLMDTEAVAHAAQ